MIAVEAGRCPLCPAGTPTRSLSVGPDYEYAAVADEFRMVACTGCRTWFLDPRPADEAITSLYPPHYGPYLFDELPRPVRWARDQVQRSKVSALARFVGPTATVLDLGCGAGALLKLIQRVGPPGWKLMGWDFPGPHLERVAAAGIEVVSRPISEVEAPEAVADAVVMNQVVEHFARPETLLRAVHRLLRPGGVVFLETPDIDGLDARLFGGFWGGLHLPRHLVLFSETSLRALVERAGFVVEHVEHLASPAFWVQSVHHSLIAAGFPAFARWSGVDNPVALAAATSLDLVSRRLGAKTSNIRLVARLRSP